MVTGVVESFKTLVCGEIRLIITVPREQANRALELWNSNVAVMTLDEAMELENGKCKCGGECEKEEHGL